MKKLLLVFTVLFLSITAFAQLNKDDKNPTNRDDTSILPDTHLGKGILPPQVSTEFLNRNPEIEHAEWIQDGENYIATFEKDGENVRSEFNYDGTWIGDFSAVDEHDIPAAVKQQLDSDFQEYTITESYKVETDEGVHYHFLVSDGNDENAVRFDAEGNQVEIAESMNNEKKDDQ